MATLLPTLPHRATSPSAKRTIFFLMLNGRAEHCVDLQQFDIGSNELLFILPNQVHLFKFLSAKMLMLLLSV
ncbi:MAG: hypothetical protein ACRYFL_12460 [Janthinobacterium lividum]